MPKVVADISMSLDGYVNAPNPVDMEQLHAWIFAGNEVDNAVLHEYVEATGAVVMGRRLFDIVDAPDGWSEDVGFGGRIKAAPPVFVVTHHEPQKVRLKRQMSFVTGGVVSAVVAARRAAGQHDVAVMGGADVISQSLAAGLVDELRIHLIPIILGAGTLLFKGGRSIPLVQSFVRVSQKATHLIYRINTK
jgi:dihydrofolate reductase